MAVSWVVYVLFVCGGELAGVAGVVAGPSEAVSRDATIISNGRYFIGGTGR